MEEVTRKQAVQVVLDLCGGKNIEDVSQIIQEAKLNEAPQIIIQQLQQYLDSMIINELEYDKRITDAVKKDIIKESTKMEWFNKFGKSRLNVGLGFWKNYCRTSWFYRLLERIGLR